MVNDAPRFDAVGAARLAHDLYGIDAVALPLPSERDQNFLLTDRAGTSRVLKIANAGESRAMLEAQQAAMAHVAAHLNLAPRPVIGVNGESIAAVRGDDGRPHFVWLISHVPGAPLGMLRHRSATLLEDFGRTIASLGCALADFDHPAIHRDFHWDLANARRVVDEYRPLVTDKELGRAIDSIVASFDVHVRPLLDALPRRAIHADLNDYNVLVSGEHASASGARVTGIVDFGDMVHSFAVGDLAIASAYMMLGATDPLDAITQLVRGHTSVAALGETELEALFGLSAMRLCMSACIAAHQLRQRPDNDYLDVSQSAVRKTLPIIAQIPFGLATAMIRAAAGLEPSASGGRLRTWLAARQGSFAPVMPFDLQTEPLLVLDLSVASLLVSAEPSENAEPLVTTRVEDAMRDAGVRVAIGRYDEPRLLYSSPLFVGTDGPLDERRTIHLGLDIFADAGTSIHAPLNGIVHAYAYNPAALDYGAMIILRHETGDGIAFYSLYGHLSRDSLTGLSVGQVVARGERFASLGAPNENGGWTPHLHFQVFPDLLGLCWTLAPKHAKRYADAGRVIRQALEEYAADVRAGTFPAEENTFHQRDLEDPDAWGG